MIFPTQVNCRRHRYTVEPKMLIGSSQNRPCSRLCHPGAWNTRTPKTAGVKAGTKSFVSLETNIVNPTLRLGFGASASARTTVGVAGRGNWRKQMPLCNGADRSCNITLPCKRADFQSVVHDERTHRTFTGGNSK
jgi:hypothetical protein